MDLSTIAYPALLVVVALMLVEFHILQAAPSPDTRLPDINPDN
jgi:hypothetical protein